MATIKVACPKCGQKVSGDDTFFGTVVQCPVCSADIRFPGEIKSTPPAEHKTPVPPRSEPVAEEALPKATFDETALDDAVPQTAQDKAVAESPGTAVSGAAAPGAAAAMAGEGGFPDNGEGEIPSPVTGAVSIVTAVLAVVTCLGGLLFAPVAIIAGHISQAKARRSPVQPAPGQTLGAIGMLIGYIWLVIAILLLALAVLFKEPLAEFIQSNRSEG